MLLKMTMSGDGAGHRGQIGPEAESGSLAASAVGRPDAAVPAGTGANRADRPATGEQSGTSVVAVGIARPAPTAAATAAATGADDERLARARAGDESAFADILRRHQAMVFSLALRIVGNRALAEELAQEVFLQLHRSLATLESGAHVAHWLRRVVSHRAIDLARQMARRPQASLSDLPEVSAGVGLAPGQDATADRRRGDTAVPSADPFLARRLRDLVASLPAAPRAVVTLRFQEDLDLSEIAATLNMPLNTVKSHLRRSLALLRGRAQALLEPMNHVSRT